MNTQPDPRPVIDLSRLQLERDELRERVKELQDENQRLRDAIESLLQNLTAISSRADRGQA